MKTSRAARSGFFRAGLLLLTSFIILLQTNTLLGQTTPAQTTQAQQTQAPSAHHSKSKRHRTRAKKSTRKTHAVTKQVTAAKATSKTTPAKTEEASKPASAASESSQSAKPTALPAPASSAKSEGVATTPASNRAAKAPKSTPTHRVSARHLAQKRSETEVSHATAAGAGTSVAAENKQPAWPASDHPEPAQVTWDNGGLKIAATNASLQQILNQVATATGTKVEGMGADERIFGEFGPGQARDVLSQLLHGSGYNFLLIGDQGLGTPRQIVLSARKSGPNAAPSSNASRPATDDSSDDDSSEPEPEEPRPLPRPGFSHPGAPRTPQEMQMQMQQMREEQQQQQQQQQDNPQNTPPPQQ